MARKDEREILMQMIYQMGMQNDFSEDAFGIFTEHQMDADISEYFVKAYECIRDNLIAIDDKINEYSVNWKTTRMPVVDLSILRIALAEIYYDLDVPVSVAINEAVNLAKKFSTDKSYKFINGVLGKAARENE